MRVWSILLSAWTVSVVHGCTTDDDCPGDVCVSSVCTAVSSLPEWSCASATPETTGTFKVSGDCTMTVQYVEVGNNLTLYGVGSPTITATTSGDRRHFSVPEGTTLTLNDLKLTGGSMDSGYPNHAGGSIYVDGTLHATSCVFFSNAAQYGGGVYSNKGSLYFYHTNFTDNTASQQGGGLSNGWQGSIHMYHSDITENTATIGGGGLANEGQVVMEDSRVSDNSAGEQGGGIRHSIPGTLTIVRSTLARNKQTSVTDQNFDGGGGGLFVNAHSVVIVRESTFDENYAEGTTHGHQIYVFQSNTGSASVVLVNTDFIQCSACGTGTDFYLHDQTMVSNSGSAAYYSLVEKNCADGSYCTEAPYTDACTDVAQGMTCAAPPVSAGCTNDYYDEYDASATVDTDPSSCVTRLDTRYLAVDPSDGTFDWSLGACGAQQFRRLVGSSEACEACDLHTFATAYRSVVLGNNTAAKYRHGRCCSNPHHDVCVKMRDEYDAHCPGTCSP